MSERGKTVWLSRERNGLPRVPAPAVVLSDVEDKFGCILVMRNGFAMRVDRGWTHDTFEEAREDAIQACQEAILYHGYLKSTLTMTRQTDGD